MSISKLFTHNIFGERYKWFRRLQNGVWLPDEGRWSKLEKGQFKPSTRLCKDNGHNYSRYGIIPCPLYANLDFQCTRCGHEIPNPKYQPKRAKAYWKKYGEKWRKKR